MQANSCLTLEHYHVKTIKFSVNEDFCFPENEQVSISPEFQREITKIDDNHACVSLKFSIDNEKGDMPFSIFADISGLFELKKKKKPDSLPLIKSNAVAILFPYLRSLITMVTANANIPPYTLPVMNIAAMFDQNDNQENQTEE